MTAGVSQAQVAAAFVASPEYLGDFVSSSYQQLLKRPADAGGLAFWRSQMQAGLSMEQFLVSLASSPEYYALHGSNTPGLITAYYNDFFGRNPTASDLNYWTGQLASGVPSNLVALTFVSSPEYHDEFVIGLFQSYFGTTISPGAAANFVQSLAPNISRFNLQVGVLSTQQFYLMG
jgi:hypothetical protein